MRRRSSAQSRSKKAGSRAKLPHSAELCRLAVDFAPNGIVAADSRGKIVLINAESEKLFGYSREELIGSPLEKLIPNLESCQYEMFTGLSRPSEAPEEGEVECYGRRKNGELFPVELSLSPARVSGGKWLFGSIVDIAERKRAEEALRDSEERFRSAFRDAGVSMIIVSLDGHFLAVNPTFCNLLGYSEQELLGRTFQSVTYPNDLGLSQARVDQALANKQGIPSFEKRYVRKDGQVRWVEVTASLVRNAKGAPQYFVTYVVDVTDRKRSEEALRESESRFRHVADAAPVMIWMSDVQKRCTYFNRTWLEFTGRSVEEELGEGWAGGLHDEDREDCLRTYQTAFEKHTPYETEFRLRRRDGVYRWLLSIGVPRCDAGGAFSGYIGSCVDVTERKAAEETMSNLGGRLIEAQEKERRRIARDLHDHIGQRIAVVLWDLRKLEGELPVDAPETVRQQVESSLQSLSDISSEVHALSHQLHSAKLELMGMVSAMKSFCQEFAEQHQVEVAFHHGEIPPDLDPDTSLCLFRILQEALMNALKYSGVRQFEVELEAERSQIQLTIRDRGVGFDVQAASRQPGLGLVSMMERVGLVKGRMSVESAPQKGTAVRVWAPIVVVHPSHAAVGR